MEKKHKEFNVEFAKDALNLREPLDTTAATMENPLGFLAVAAVCGASEAIEAQESQGQSSFVGSDTLPTKLSTEDKLILELNGFIFFGKVPGDDIFQYITMPGGWKKARTDHSMWSDLLDDKGRKRGSIFYKAAFYDRDAHMNLNCRISFGMNHDNENEEVVEFLVKDHDGTIIHAFEPIKLTGDPSKDYDIKYSNRSPECLQWMNDNFPNYKDPAAYWDVESLMPKNDG